MQRAQGRWHAPDEAIQLQGGGAARQSGSLAKVQPQGLLRLQAADQAVADRQPVQAGDEQLAGQQAALVDERLIWLARGALVTACRDRGGTMSTACAARSSATICEPSSALASRVAREALPPLSVFSVKQEPIH